MMLPQWLFQNAGTGMMQRCVNQPGIAGRQSGDESVDEMGTAGIRSYGIDEIVDASYFCSNRTGISDGDDNAMIVKICGRGIARDLSAQIPGPLPWPPAPRAKRALSPVIA
jgi:hypothetical protein